MCRRYRIGWRCGCFFDKWEKCAYVLDKGYSIYNCPSNPERYREWEAPPVLMRDNLAAFKAAFRYKHSTFVKDACCSPHCCHANLLQTANEIDIDLAVYNSPQDIRAAAEKYHLAANQHMFGCMKFFANGLWKTNSMRSHMDLYEVDDLLPKLRGDLLALSGDWTIRAFSEGELVAVHAYENRIQNGLGLRSPLGEINWKALSLKLEGYYASLKAYNPDSEVEQRPTLPRVSAEELRPQDDQEVPAITQAAGEVLGPQTTAAPLQLNPGDHQLITTASSATQGHQQHYTLFAASSSIEWDYQSMITPPSAIPAHQQQYASMPMNSSNDWDYQSMTPAPSATQPYQQHNIVSAPTSSSSDWNYQSMTPAPSANQPHQQHILLVPTTPSRSKAGKKPQSNQNRHV